VGICREFFVTGLDGVERDVELLEDRSALWGDRSEEQRRRRRDAHAVLRARQISSHGHFRAHSGSKA